MQLHGHITKPPVARIDSRLLGATYAPKEGQTVVVHKVLPLTVLCQRTEWKGTGKGPSLKTNRVIRI
ncbi:hypothetical protein BJ956_001132 [Arthrobacter psychrochitiniphilus]|nr:hypothetical protein [Arthrobacter psychrochitiniphilus]